MISRESPKTASDIDELIKEQLRNAGFDEQGKPLVQTDTNSNTILNQKLETEDREDISNNIKKTKEIKIDDRFIRLEDLPSNFKPYPGRDHLMIRPFSVLELKLIARAIEYNNVDYITQAIDNCIDMDAYQLTIPDYFYLYYWFRLESYPNTPHFMEWVCDEEHVDGQGNKYVCGYENTSQLTKSDIKVIHLDDLGFDISQLDKRLDFPRVRLLEDLTEANEDKKKIDQDKTNESSVTFKLDDLILIDAAKWIKEGTTIWDKLKVLEQEPDLSLYEIASKTNKALQFGVYEYTLVTCMRCGAKRRYRVLLDAPRFFPFIN